MGKRKEYIYDYFPVSKWLRSDVARTSSAAALGYIVGGPQGLGIASAIASRMPPLPPDATREGMKGGASAYSTRAESDAGFSRFNYGHGVQKFHGYKKALGPRHVLSAVSSRINSSPTLGSQIVNIPPSFTGDGVNNFLQVLSSSDLPTLYANLDSDETVPGAASTTVRTERMNIKYIKLKYTLKNQTNVPVTIQFYDIIAKRDTASSQTFFGGATTMDPQTLFTTGINNENVGSSSGLTSTFPGATPFMSERFCQYYTVKKVTKFTLHAGTEHVHYVKLKPSMLFNREISTSQYNIRKNTYWPMLIIKGDVVNDSTTTTIVTYSSWSVDVIAEYHAEFESLAKNRTVWTANSTLANAVVANQETILEDTDAMQTVQVA